MHRGVGLVVGCFALYALASSFLPELLASTVGNGYRLGELAAGAVVLVIASVVWSHDRRARRNVDPLAQRLSQREPAGHGGQFGSRSGGSADAGNGSGNAGSFNAFDSFRAFGERAAL